MLNDECEKCRLVQSKQFVVTMHQNARIRILHFRNFLDPNTGGSVPDLRQGGRKGSKGTGGGAAEEERRERKERKL